jgi:hypothetical protein
MHPYVMQTIARQRERELRKPAARYSPLPAAGGGREPIVAEKKVCHA